MRHDDPALTTKQNIAERFRRKAHERGVDRVRIADIVDDMGINRNTFYYHFANKYEVAIYLFRRDLDAQLRTMLPDAELVSSSHLENDPGNGLAFYTHRESGARTLDQAQFITAVLNCVSSDRPLYKPLFSARATEFTDYVQALWRGAIEDDIDFMLSGRYMPPEVKGMLAHTSVASLMGLVEFHLANPSHAAALADERTNPFHNYLAESLYAAIQAHPINRPRNASR